jgi:signal transduction histidine kinase
MFQYILVMELVIFSVCLLLTGIKTRAVYIWLCSNFLAILACLNTMQYINSGWKIDNTLGGTLFILSSILKSLSFADRGFTRKSNRIPTIFIIISLILAAAIFVLGETVFRLFLLSSSGILMCLSAIVYLIHNKQWIGLASLKYCVVILCLSVLACTYSLLISYPIGSTIRFFPDDSGITYQAVFLPVLFFFFHIFFIGLIIGRQARENIFKLRKSLRIQQAAQQSKANEKASAALAEERYDLLKLLTHEVRQPLNTAQATLDKIGQDLRREQTEPDYIQQTLIKAQSTVNSIALSISNSILGATLITQGRPSQLHSIDLCDVAQLALFDLNLSQRSRIQKMFEQPVIFAHVDPIILRLAIRNLLENATKYSPSGSPILFEIITDQEKLALVIRVTNQINDPSTLSADIFERNKRGVDSLHEGSGLGLYIVREVAELHKGEASYHLVSAHQVAFELSIPA